MAIPSNMRALRLDAPGKLVPVEIPVPAPAPDEVLIKTAAATICTSDLNDLRENPFHIPLPRVLGHEGAGIVAARGEKVQDFAVGDRVAAHPVIPCYACDTCRRGLPHLCEHMGHLGLDREGAFAEYFCIPAHRVRHVPPGVDLAVAALLEPVSVCLEAIARARVVQGDILLVVGDGPFGIMITKLAFRRHPAKVILVGQRTFRLAHVPEAVCLNERRVPDLLQAIHEAAGGKGIDAAVLAVGSAEALEACVQSLRPRGRLVIFSAIIHPAPVDLFRVHVKELELLGSCNDEDFIDEAMTCLNDSSLKLGKVVTHRIPFDQWERAFWLAANGKDEALKVALTFEEAAGWR